MPEVILDFLWWILTRLGFVFLCAFLLWLFFLKFQKLAKEEFLSKQKWVFLHLKLPKINNKSTLAVEQIFSQLHILAGSLSFWDRVVLGKVLPWYSLEVVSVGGRVSFFVKVPIDAKNLFESAFYAQYPEVNIEESRDYAEGFHPDLLSKGLDLWGTEVGLSADPALPILVYRDFEHSLSSEKIIDPLRPLFEALGSLSRNEIYAVQLLVRPVPDGEWKGKSEEFVGKLIGGSPNAPEGQKAFANLPDVEKERINNVLRKASRPGFEVKIRHLYMAEGGDFNNSRKSLGLAAYKTLGSPYTNQFKEDTHSPLSLKIKPFVWGVLEKPFLQARLLRKKQEFLKAFVGRRFDLGGMGVIFNTEELATLYHLPIVSEDSSASAGMESGMKASQPPPNLPIGQIDE